MQFLQFFYLVHKRSPSSVILDIEEIRDVQDELTAKMAQRADKQKVDLEKTSQIISSIKFEAQLKVIEEEKGLIFKQDNKRIAQAIKVIVSADLDHKRDKFKKAYFRALLLLAPDIMGSDYYEINPKLEADFLNLVPKIKTDEQLSSMT